MRPRTRRLKSLSVGIACDPFGRASALRPPAATPAACQRMIRRIRECAPLCLARTRLGQGRRGWAWIERRGLLCIVAGWVAREADEADRAHKADGGERRSHRERF